MKKIIVSIMGIALLGLGMSAQAAMYIPSSDNSSDGTGVYVEANAGWGWANEKVKGARHDSNNDGWAANANVGYKFSPYWGLEVGFYYIDDTNFGSGVKSTNDYAIAGAVKGIYPIGASGFNVFGKLGGAASRYQLKGPVVGGGYDETKAVALVAAGVGYSITENLDLTVQGVAMSKNDNVPAKYFALGGVTYTFG